MLNKEDFKKIGEEVAKVIEDNVNPQFEGIHSEIKEMKGEIKEIKADMVTKSYLDDKMADLEGGLISKLRKEDEKVNRLIEIMSKKSLLADHDVKHLNELQVFPRIR